jgi:hypothetical protein
MRRVEPPVRLRFATAAPCLANALRVWAGRLAIERFFWATGPRLSHVALGGLHLPLGGHVSQRPTARSSSALFIFDRPLMFFSRASL